MTSILPAALLALASLADAPGAGAPRGAAPARLSLDGDDWRVHEVFPNEWHWRRFLNKEFSPKDPTKWLPGGGAGPGWLPARVPGHVQEDLRRSGELPDPFERLSSRQYEWTSQRDWIYSRTFHVPASWQGRRVRLHFEGIDPGGLIVLNNEAVGTHHGMFVPFEAEVSRGLRYGAANRLDVVVFHAPDQQARPDQENRTPLWKARFATSWDFAPRLIPVGIWDSVWLEATGPAWIDAVDLRPTLDGAGHGARGTVEVRVRSGGDAAAAVSRVDVEVRLGGRRVAASSVAVAGADPARPGDLTRVRLEVPSVEPWHPNGLGPQTLYEAAVTLRDRGGRVLDEKRTPFGFRRVRWHQAEGAPASALPYGAEVNGRRVFLKGWNWVPADQLYARVTPAQYERFVRLMRDSGANLVRVWGGGLIEKEAFYDLCDRYGIMIWQELPQSSRGGRENLPGTDESYLHFVEAQMRSIVPRRSHHPSLVIWCGGNELIYDDWRPLGYEYPTMAKMKALLDELDPDALFLPTSPSGGAYFSDPAKLGQMHDTHGPWKYAGPQKHYAHYNAIDPMFHTEFGVESAASVAGLLRIAGPKADPKTLWPPDETNPLWVHHGGTWIHRKPLEAAFGPIDTLDRFVRASQFLQAEGLRYALEAHRRRWPRAVGAMPWQLNEPWPNAACTNAVEHSGEPKPAFWSVKRAFAPRSLAAEYSRLVWRPGDRFEAHLWWVAESSPAVGAARVRAELRDAGGRVLATAEGSLAAGAGVRKAEKVATLSWPINARAGAVLVLTAAARDGQGRLLAEHRSLHAVSDDLTLRPLLELPATTVTYAWKGDVLEMTNTGGTVAAGVWIDARGGWLGDNDRHLLPGESWRVAMSGARHDDALVSWWNAARSQQAARGRP